MTGKLKTKGNMMLATKLDGVLKVSCRETDKEITHPSSSRLPSRRLSSDGGVGLDSQPRYPAVRTTLFIVYCHIYPQPSVLDGITHSQCLFLDSENEWGYVHRKTTENKHVKA